MPLFFCTQPYPMASPLKDLYSPEFYDRFAKPASAVLPAFNKKKFNQLIFDKDWGSKELKQRMRHTAEVLHHFLPDDFEQAAEQIISLIRHLQKSGFTENGLEFMFLPDYVEVYGIDHFRSSVRCMEQVTQFTSCEFAVRPFLLRYPDKMMQQMQRWSLHKDHKVRRLASEGTRPRLPWAMAVPALKKDPAPVLSILENLKQDSSEWVRRSVANNLNDIAKDHPQIVTAIAKKWKGLGKETDAIIKHGCRTLLKKGDAEILSYYGLSNSQDIQLTKTSLLTPEVRIGKELCFAFHVHNRSGRSQTVRLEYGIYYLRLNGQLSKKVFKISERMLAPDEKLTVQRKQSFRLITTRRFYPGQQQLSIIINGQERKTMPFILLP